MAITLIQATQDAAVELQLLRPLTIYTSTNVISQRLLRIAQKACARIIDEYDWLPLLTDVSATAVAGVNQSLPADFVRMAEPVLYIDDITANQPTTYTSWENAITSSAGGPYWRVSSSAIQVAPALVGGEIIRYRYVSNNATSNGARFAADTDTFLLGDELFISAIILEWTINEALPSLQNVYLQYKQQLRRAIANVKQTPGLLTSDPIGTGYPSNGY